MSKPQPDMPTSPEGAGAGAGASAPLLASAPTPAAAPAPMSYPPQQQQPPQGYQVPPQGYQVPPQGYQVPPQGYQMYQHPPYGQQPMYGYPAQPPHGYPAQPSPQGYPQPMYQQQPMYVDAQGRPIAVAAQPVGYAVPPQSVVVAMPYQQGGVAPAPNGEWSTDFCDMCNDMEVCCLTCFCPCVQYGLNQEMLDGSDCVCHACIWFALAYFCGAPCIAHCVQREKLRLKFGLREDCGPDLFATCCCPHCAICQEARELKIRNAAAGAPPVQQMI